MTRTRQRPWCVVLADKIVGRYGSETRAEREADRMRRAAVRSRSEIRVAHIPSGAAMPLGGREHMTTQPTTVCDPKIYENGRTVCILDGCSTAIEAVVVRVRELLKVSLDWHYVGGRAYVLTLEPPERDDQIRSEIRMAMPTWVALSAADLATPRRSDTP